jgi:hypothetical protein
MSLRLPPSATVFQVAPLAQGRNKAIVEVAILSAPANSGRQHAALASAVSGPHLLQSSAGVDVDCSSGHPVILVSVTPPGRSLASIWIW